MLKKLAKLIDVKSLVTLALKAYIVYKGSGFRTQAPYGYRFYVI